MTGDPAYCRECGSELPPGAKFCAECGEAVPPDIAEAADGASGRETTPAAAAPDAGESSGPDGGSPEDDVAGDDRSGDEGVDDPAAGAGRSAAGAGAAVDEVSTVDDQDPGSSLEGRTLLNCLIGSVIGFVAALVLVLSAPPLYFVGVMVGSGVAGWFQRRGAGSGALVGGVAGLVSTLLFAPFAVVLALVGLGQLVATTVPFGAGGPFDLLPWMGGGLPETQGLLTVLLGIGAVVLAVSALINLVVGTVSGAVGGAIATE